MRIRMTVTIVCATLVTGCTAQGGSHLVFAQNTTIGLSIGAPASTQGFDLVFGYKDQNFAVVPVAHTEVDGGQIKATSIGNEAGGDDGADHVDALSVLGQFEFSASGGGDGNELGLGRFFATGMAAKTLADGFSYKLAPDCTRDGVESIDEAAEPAAEDGEDP